MKVTFYIQTLSFKMTVFIVTWLTFSVLYWTQQENDQKPIVNILFDSLVSQVNPSINKNGNKNIKILNIIQFIIFLFILLAQ